MAHIKRRQRSGRRPDWLAVYIDPSGKERSKSFQRKVDAERWLTGTEAAKLGGSWTDPALGRTPLADWLSRWWATTTNLRPSSRVRDESYMRNHVLPRFGDVPLGKITQLDVRGWVAELDAQGLAPATIHLIYQILHRAMAAAVDGGLLPNSPCRNVPLPRIEHKEMRFLQPREVGDVADAIGPDHSTLVYTAAYTGARWGELTGLRVQALDLLRRKLHVREQLTEVRGELRLGAPLKTAAALRTVALPRFLCDMLAEQLRRPEVTGTGLVFPSTEGTPMRRSNFRRRHWLPAVARADMEPLRFHDLRHTAVALMVAQGVHPKAVQERIGHSSIKVTLDRYGHLFPALDEEIADGLDLLYRDSAVPSTSLRATGSETGEKRALR